MIEPWLRLYTGLLEDRRWHAMPRDLAWMLIGLWMAAKRGGAGDGRLPALDDLAFALRRPENEVADALAALAALGLIDRLPDGAFAPHGWGKRQYSDTSADRARRYRDRQRSSRDASRDASHPNVTNTDTDTDTDTDTESDTDTDITRAPAREGTPASPVVRASEPAPAIDRSTTTGPMTLAGRTTPPPSSPASPPAAPARYSAAFERFWAAYPRREAKPAAWAAWQRARPDADTLRAIDDGLDRWRRSDQWGRGVYQHPATWINRRQWEDEPAAAEARAAPARGQPRRPSVAEVSRQALDLVFGADDDSDGGNGHGPTDVSCRLVDAGGDLARAPERPRAG